MADVQRAGGIGRDELDLHPPASPDLRAAVVVPGAQDGRDQGAVGVRGKEKIDEAGAGDLDTLDQGRRRQQGDQPLGEVPRPGPRGLGEGQGQIGGKVAMGLVLGALDLGHRQLARAPVAVSREARQAGAQKVRNLLLHGHSRGKSRNRGARGIGPTQG